MGEFLYYIMRNI